MTTYRHRIAVVTAVLVVMALALTGCGASAPVPAQDLVWATGRITADGPARAVADAWNRVHPDGPKVRVVPLPESVDDQHQQLAVELGAGIPDFDILDLDVVWTAEFAAHGWLTDLSDLRPAVEATSLPAPVQSATWNGRLWAAPYTTDVGLLYYRKDLVPPPRSWEDLVASAESAGAGQHIAPYVVDGAPAEGLVVEYLEYLWRYGGVLEVDGDHVGLDDRAAVAAMTFMRDGFVAHGANPAFFAPSTPNLLLEDARRTFQSGGAVFLRSWPYAYQPMNASDPASRVHGRVGVLPLPTPAALGGHNLGVSRFSRSPRAAEDFVRFASTDLGVQRDLAQNWSVAPTAKQAYDAAADPELSGVVQQALGQARTRPTSELWTEMSQEIQQQVVAGTTGRSSPTEAVAIMHRLLDATAASR